MLVRIQFFTLFLVLYFLACSIFLVRTDALSFWYFVVRWSFIDPWKPQLRPSALEEPSSPAWIAAPSMSTRDTANLYTDWTLDVDRHYMECHNHNTSA